MKSNNPFVNTRIEFHILQSFPVTCLNRDDVGAPKTAVIGGTTRARVSSQCWKRQVRQTMQQFGVKLGIRTKRIAEYLGRLCQEQGASVEQADACGKVIASALSKDTLHFFSETEAQAFVQYAKDNEFDSSALKDKEVYRLARKVFNPAIDGLDIALFGRMVAQAAELNVEAAASFAHAISTHKVTNDIEFFTALDDIGENSGSAHMGCLEFNSATYYRYISLDLGQLWDTLAGEQIIDAVDVFVKSLFLAIPNARQTTQSGASMWEFAKIFIRKGQRLQVPFEDEVKSKAGGYLNPSIEYLKEYLSKKEKLSGSLFEKRAEFTFGEDDSFNIDSLVHSIKQQLNEIAA